MIDVKDIYWAAGFLDGEGCFSWPKNNVNCARVDAPQNDRELLDRLLVLFGGGVYPRKKNGTWMWHLDSNYAIGLMMTLYPLMSKKRQGEIKNVISLWKVSKNTSCASKFRTHCFYGHPWIEENKYKGKDHVVCLTCKRLNAKECKTAKKLNMTLKKYRDNISLAMVGV